MAIEVVGDSSLWKKDLFPEELIPEILELVITSWEVFEKPDCLDREVPISKAFTKKIRSEKNRRADLPFHIWCELSTLATQTEQDGRIDILFAYIGTTREDIYFAFECKRLRIPYPSGLNTNNSDYVGDQGMMCFVTGKYSHSVTNAGMIGYVMDSQVNLAITSVGELIKKKRDALRLPRNSGLDLSSIIPNRHNARETTHMINAKKLKIHHLFLAV
ncbi:MAG: hypothetical protein JXM79_04075 [Sedimentisphaerales bacterium]|nr:hypothetical protein [Sedimentisphaerales bacterium]